MSDSFIERNDEVIVKIIRTLREKSKDCNTIGKLSLKTGLSKSQISRVENFEREITFDVVGKILEAHGKTYEWMRKEVSRKNITSRNKIWGIVVKETDKIKKLKSYYNLDLFKVNIEKDVIDPIDNLLVDYSEASYLYIMESIEKLRTEINMFSQIEEIVQNNDESKYPIGTSIEMLKLSNSTKAIMKKGFEWQEYHQSNLNNEVISFSERKERSERNKRSHKSNKSHFDLAEKIIAIIKRTLEKHRVSSKRLVEARLENFELLLGAYITNCLVEIPSIMALNNCGCTVEKLIVENVENSQSKNSSWFSSSESLTLDEKSLIQAELKKIFKTY